MERENRFRFEEHDGIRRIYQETALDKRTVKATGHLHGMCPDCRRKQEIMLSSMKMGYDECIDSNYLTWRCPYCDRLLFAYLCWCTAEVAETIEEVFKKK